METKRPTNPAAEDLIGKYFPVFGDEYSFISLRDYSGLDTCIEEAARVSYSSSSTRKVSETRGLIRYLKNHNHSTPFEMVQLKFHICCPIFVMRQHIRHRMSSTNEMSGRYSLMPLMFYTPSAENFQKQSKSNKQGRDGTIEIEKYNAAVSQWNKLRKDSSRFYQDLTEEELAKELARIDLPLSTFTNLYWTIDLHNLFHYLTLRCDGHAQYEIRAYSNIMAALVRCVTPLAFEAWVDYQFCATKFSRQEMNIVSDLMINNNLNINILMEKYGLSKREMKEFPDKLKRKELPSFDLDFSSAKSYEHFEKIIKAHTPVIDSNPQGI